MLSGPQPLAKERLESSLLFAIHAGRAENIEALFEAGASPNFSDKLGHTPFIKASKNGDAPCVRALLHGGALPDQTNKYAFTALHLACRRGHHQVVRALCEAGASTDLIDESPGHKGEKSLLMWASASGHHQCVQDLLKGGATIDQSNKQGLNALSFAMHFSNNQCVHHRRKEYQRLNKSALFHR